MSKKHKHHHYFSAILVFILFVASFNIFIFLTKPTEINNLESTSETFEYWQGVITEYPSYKDGYLTLARLHIEKGNTQTAKLLINQARELSPNENLILPLSQ